MVLSVIVNGMMAVLLFVTIIYCWRLNTRIRLLQDSKSELARIIREFDESTRRATESIAQIHTATNRISENIQHKIDKANFLVTDLDLMIERGGKLVGQRPETPPPARAAAAGGRMIDQVGRAARSESAMAAAAGNVAPITPLADSDTARRGNRPRSRAEQELMSVLKKNESNG
jgi:hypothetical protein